MQQLTVDGFRAAEDSSQRVVVLLRDGVELVIVAAGAAERQAEKRLAHGVNLLIDGIHARLFLVSPADDLRAEHKKAGRGNLLVALLLAGAGQQVACNLLAN